jgi:hypothetical protein
MYVAAIRFDFQTRFLHVPGQRAGFVLLTSFLATFLFIRTSARLMRSPKVPWWPGSIETGGLHVHHLVFGIVMMLLFGFLAIAVSLTDPWRELVAAGFGVGAGLTLDEYALWLHLKDVYWAEQGRQSVDAIFCVLVICGVLVGGASFLSGELGSAAWWSSVAAIAVNLVLCVICLLKGKVVTGVVGIVVGVVALVGAIRLAKPGSWWATRRYASRPKRALRADHRYGQRYRERWNRLRDLVAGAPSQPGPG